MLGIQVRGQIICGRRGFLFLLGNHAAKPFDGPLGIPTSLGLKFDDNVPGKHKLFRPNFVKSSFDMLLDLVVYNI